MAIKFKLAIIIENTEILLWQYRVLESLINSDSIVINSFILNDAGDSEKNFRKPSLIYSIHNKIDRFIFSKNIDFDKKVNICERYETIPLVKYAPESAEKAIQTEGGGVTDSNPDLIVYLGNLLLGSNLAKEFKTRVLTYNISSQIAKTSAPTCYWEVMRRKPEIEAAIQLFFPDLDNQIEIFRTGIMPYPNSININRNNLYDLASLVIPRLIERIASEGIKLPEVANGKNNAPEDVSLQSELFQPSSIQSFSNLIRLQVNFLIKKIKYHKIGRWFLMFRLNENNLFFPDEIGSYKILKAPDNMFWADPFVISRDKFHYLFIEEYLYKTDRGHISVLKLDENGNLLSNQRIIEKPYHMSYPYVFEHNDTFYMIPETGANKTIELYKCIDFPHKWEFVQNIMENFTAKDTTVFFYNNKWWLFTSAIKLSNATVSYNELFLYHSDDLFSSNWQSHSMNPIVTDHKVSRPAGRIFIYDNKIFRPSQDCSGIYGGALNLNIITKLSETEYEESLIQKLEPTWNKHIKGIHTSNFSDKISVVDAFSFRNRFINKSGFA